MNKYLEKQIKVREENLKYDFLPSMIEIIERPENKLANIILFVIIALIITTLVWAGIFKIDVAVTATGSILPEGNVVKLDSISGGRIAKINVKDGEYVKKGDMILSFDTKEAELSVSEYEYNLKVLEVQKEVYKKLYDNLKKKNNSSVKIKTSKYKKYASFAETIVQENKLYEKKLSLIKNSIEKEEYKQEYMYGILQNINTLDSKIPSVKSSLQTANDNLKNLKIKASVDGKVTQMSMISEGLLVKSGETVGCLIPKDKENIFIAYVSDKDISQIRKKDKVSIKIAAYNDTKYEYMEGKVISVGDVAINIEEKGAMYMVEIQIKDLPKDIKVGMEGSCDIIIGKRTVLDYFLEPFKEGFGSGLKER